MAILTIFKQPPLASIWTFWQSDFACMGHGTGILKYKTFWEALGTFRGSKVQKRGFFGKKWPFWNFQTAATCFNLGLLTIRFCMLGAWNLDFRVQDVWRVLDTSRGLKVKKSEIFDDFLDFSQTLLSSFASKNSIMYTLQLLLSSYGSNTRF